MFTVSGYDQQTLLQTGQLPPSLIPTKDEAYHNHHQTTLQKALVATQRHLEYVANKIWCIYDTPSQMNSSRQPHKSLVPPGPTLFAVFGTGAHLA